MNIMRAQLGSNFQHGFTYIGLLLFIAITGVGLSVAGMSWQYQVRAEKEKQLLFVGAEFRNAINSYYASSPDAAKVYPASLNDLLLDKRLPNIKRHLRKIYLDPMTGKADWGVVKQQGRIVGIYSRSSLMPYKQKGFSAADANFASSRRYNDWSFVGAGIETTLQGLKLSLTTNASKNKLDAAALESIQQPLNNNSNQDKAISTKPNDPASNSESKVDDEPILYMQDGVITLNPKLSNQK